MFELRPRPFDHPDAVRLIAGLKAAGSTLDRKVLADIAVTDPTGFAGLAEMAKTALGSQSGTAAEG